MYFGTVVQLRVLLYKCTLPLSRCCCVRAHGRLRTVATGKGKGKGKGLPKTSHVGPEGEQMYSSTVPSTSALDGDGWSAPRPGRFTHDKETRCPLSRGLGGQQGRSGRVQKISPTTGIRSPNRPARSETLYRLSYCGL